MNNKNTNLAVRSSAITLLAVLLLVLLVGTVSLPVQAADLERVYARILMNLLRMVR